MGRSFCRHTYIFSHQLYHLWRSTFVGIFSSINEKLTIANVKEYFEKDFPRLRAKANLNNIISLQSSRLNVVPSDSNQHNNTQEDKVISNIRAKELVQATCDVINNAPSIYKIILKNLYILNQNNTVTMKLTDYGASQYAVYKNRALLYFAETYQDIYDLVEYV
ncbi:hypothetical protein FC88_GL000333 [Companilactobacillus futsaii JCM 17355]|uniref:Phage transcriptional regulator, ArpU family n=1 Tax=Companilactobacillus futsaii JCM 17355 TaxID=1423818 RepID=A0ABR5P5M5_9LACO|nr:hypothetical protein FC88_GL000333 [Companilactobacillus futsaii JCM 17355]